jgi:hypothetical protein
MKEIINSVLSSRSFVDSDLFLAYLDNQLYTVRYSVMRNYTGNDKDTYLATGCFFFYDKQFLAKTFYCEVGSNKTAHCFEFQCNDANRSDDWEWVNVR